MKQCPDCGNTYTDDTLRYCLADGAVLEDPSTAETIATSPSGGRMRINPSDERTLVVPAYTPAPPQKSLSGPLLGGVIAILVMVILALGGLVVWQTLKDREAETGNSSPSPSKSPTPDDEKVKLQNQINDLKRQMEARKSTKSPANVPANSAATPSSLTVTANSPADGFLALRSEPNSETGERVSKIPHGTEFTLGACGEYITTSRGNRGRWCAASYAGQYGWVFDAYVKYP